MQDLSLESNQSILVGDADVWESLEGKKFSCKSFIPSLSCLFSYEQSVIMGLNLEQIVSQFTSKRLFASKS